MGDLTSLWVCCKCVGENGEEAVLNVPGGVLAADIPGSPTALRYTPPHLAVIWLPSPRTQEDSGRYIKFRWIAALPLPGLPPDREVSIPPAIPLTTDSWHMLWIMTEVKLTISTPKT